MVFSALKSSPMRSNQIISVTSLFSHRNLPPLHDLTGLIRMPPHEQDASRKDEIRSQEYSRSSTERSPSPGVPLFDTHTFRDTRLAVHAIRTHQPTQTCIGRATVSVAVRWQYRHTCVVEQSRCWRRQRRSRVHANGDRHGRPPLVCRCLTRIRFGIRG